LRDRWGSAWCSSSSSSRRSKDKSNQQQESVSLHIQQPCMFKSQPSSTSCSSRVLPHSHMLEGS
jgi:hypothetical protein